jgi:diguanylate cyclase (GGDEF)-like protein
LAEHNKKDKVLTEIVRMLDSNELFTDIVKHILVKAEDYLKTTNACILQINSNGTAIDTIADYRSENGYDLMIHNRPLSKFNVICGSDMLIFNDCTSNKNYKKILDILKVKSCVTVPILINGMIAMYFGVFDRDKTIEWNDHQLQLINDVAIIIQSIAQKKIIDRSLLSSYEVLKEILSNIGSGIIVCNRDNGSVLFENRIAQDSQEIRRSMKAGIEDYFNSNVTYHGRPAEYYDSESGLWFEIKFADLTWIDGNQVIICTAMDITQKKKNQQKIEYQAQNDFLTGLYNRMKCEHDLQKLVKRALEDKTTGAVFFIDLDDFKHINDGLGHQYGDILLQQIAVGLQSIAGLRGNCYRMGGDEFIVIIRPEIYEYLESVITQVITMFNKPWYIMDTEYYCTMSMGVVTFPTSGTDVNELIKKADIAMYEAKKSGKNRYTFYDEGNDSNSSKRLDIENNMRLAVASECNEFVVYYQPVVDTFTGKCVSCEALVRWDSKVLGFMGPGEFIPLAEYLGLITYIGDYVLEAACIKCREWNEKGYPDFRVNINLSVVQLLQKNVIENINRMITVTGVNPSNVVLEITETFAINDMERVMKIIEGIKALGVGIALDDFGTGYSSLNYIKQLPLDLIKVDKTFIDDILEDDYAQAFIKLIVELSKTIGTKICVEGVEKVEQYELLKELGVDYIQGYYFGKPVNSDEFEKMNLK